MKNITTSQKRIIIITVVIAVSFLCAWLFIYLPSNRKIHRLEEELESITSQIDSIEEIISQGESYSGVFALEDKNRALDSKFPQKEEEPLRMLSDFARKMNINIISTKCDSKVPFFGQGKKGAEVEGKRCQRVLVTMSLNGTYKDMIEYIQEVKKSLPSLITVESVRIREDTSGTSRLNFLVKLYLYLLA